jgi:Xaa-Pro aminopeptidase
MKRGLMQWDRELLPESELNIRQMAIKAKMAARGLKLLAIFGDNYASEDVSYLTNLNFYWAKGLLLIGLDREPVIFTELSKRVHAWIHEVCPVNEVHSSRNLGKDLGRYILDNYEVQDTINVIDKSSLRSNTLGVSTFDHLPESVRLELEKELPGWDIVEAGEILEELRLQPTPGELKRSTVAAHMAIEAVHKVASKAEDGIIFDHNVVSIIERHCRISGAQDVLVKVGSAGGESIPLGAPRGNKIKFPIAIDIKVQYLGCWARVGRIVTGNGTLGQAPSILQKMWSEIKPGITIEEAKKILCQQMSIEDNNDFVFLLPGSIVPDDNYFGLESHPSLLYKLYFLQSKNFYLPALPFACVEVYFKNAYFLQNFRY